MRCLVYSANQQSSYNVWSGIFPFQLNSAAGRIMNAECSAFITVSETSTQDVIGDIVKVLASVVIWSQENVIARYRMESCIVMII